MADLVHGLGGPDTIVAAIAAAWILVQLAHTAVCLWHDGDHAYWRRS